MYKLAEFLLVRSAIVPVGRRMTVMQIDRLRVNEDHLLHAVNIRAVTVTAGLKDELMI